MMRYTLAGFTALGTRQTRHGVIEGAEGTVAATRDPLVAAARHGAIEGAEGAVAATRVLVTATRHVAVEGVGGTIAATRVLVTATRHGVIEGAEGTLAATRDPLVAAARHAEVEVLEGALDAQAYLAAAPSYLVPGMRRFGLSRFSCLGTLQSRHMAVEGAEGTIVATRDPLVAADRLAAIAGLGGYLAGRSYAVPDVSGGVSVMFKEVYPI